MITVSCYRSLGLHENLEIPHSESPSVSANNSDTSSFNSIDKDKGGPSNILDIIVNVLQKSSIRMRASFFNISGDYSLSTFST